MNGLAQILHQISYMALPLLLAMVLREYAYGWMGVKCGDRTAKLQGRMLILVGLLVFDKDLRVIHTITGTFASGLSGTILSTALGLGTGAAQ